MKGREFLSRFLFPRVCVMCGREGAWLCERCVPHVRVRRSLNIAQQPTRVLDGVIAAVRYAEPSASALVKLLKYRGAYDVTDALRAVIRIFLSSFSPLPVCDAIVPVPLHARRVRERGFNQAEVLAAVWAHELNAPVELLLERQRYTKMQAHLTRAARQANMRRAFALRRNVGYVPRTVALVDDVYTTGATMEACAAVLKQAGAERVFGLAFAFEE